MTSPSSVVLATVVLSVYLPALQARPNFTGTWTIDRERSESPLQGESFEPPTFVITQTESDVTIETRRRTASSRVRYPIGSVKAPEEAVASTSSRAYWAGDSLVTEGTRTIQGQTVSVRETRSLEASGSEMTVETLLVVQHGYSFRGAQNYAASKDVYRKAVPDLQ